MLLHISIPLSKKSNSSASPDLSALSLRYWVYVAQGLVLVLCNGVIVAAYLVHGVLRARKELALPVALAFCDALDGLAAVLAGIGRNWLIWQGTAFALSSRWECYRKPWNWVWTWTQHTMDPTLLAISCDRLIAVGWPLYHYGLGHAYSKVMVGLAWGPGTVLWVYAAYLSHGYQAPEKPSLCHNAYLHDEGYHRFHKGWRLVLSSASVAVYAVVLVIYALKGEESNRGHKRQSQQERKMRAEYESFQRKVTTTLAISCLFTAFLYVVPQLSKFILPYFVDLQSSGAAAVMSMSYVIENFNKLANISLYSIRLQNVRLGIVCISLLARSSPNRR